MDGPLPKQGCVPLLVIVPFLGMDPGHSKDSLFYIQPLESRETSTLNHADQPVTHPLWPIGVDGFNEWAYHGGCVVTWDGR